MKLELQHYLKAGTPLIYLKTNDYTYAQRYIQKAVSQVGYSDDKGNKVERELLLWSCSTNMWDKDGSSKLIQQTGNPMVPLATLEEKLKDNKPYTLVLFDYHKFIMQPNVWSGLVNLVPKMAATNSNIIIVSSIITIPSEIENYVSVINYPLPDRNELANMTVKVFQDNQIDIKTVDIDAIVNYGLGQTRTAYLDSLYLLISSAPVTTHNACQFIKAQKESWLNQTDLLKPLSSDNDFSSLVGYDVMKNFTKRMIAGKLGRGVLILGVPGGGKTAFCSCLGKETGRPVLQLDFGRLMGGIVGETEAKTAQALEIADAMQPAILFIDEIEKGLAGSGSGAGSGDSGTSKRQGGQFLKWLSDHTSDVYVVATANDLSALPSEFLRAERWDTIFFVDIPEPDQAEAIFNLYKSKYGLEQDTSCDIAEIAGWTGAEIKSLCRIAKGTGITLKEATAMIVPMCKVAKEKLDGLRLAASKFAIPANAPKSDTQEAKTGRGVFGVTRL